MSRYADQVRDEYGRFVPGVSVYVYKWDADAQVAGDLEALTDDLSAPLTNPLTSDADGLFYFNSLDGQKLLEFHYGGKDQLRELILVGALPVPEATFAGLFINAVALTIPVGMDLIVTTGYSSLDVGAAVYTYDAAVNSAYVIAHPRTSFISLNGRGFRLSLEQDITPEMLGAGGLGLTDDTAAAQAAIDVLVAAGGGVVTLEGSYKTTSALVADADYIFLRGRGPKSRLLLSNATQDGVVFGNGTTARTFCGISDVEINVTGVTKSAGSAVRFRKVQSGFTERLRVANQFLGWQITDSVLIYSNNDTLINPIATTGGGVLIESTGSASNDHYFTDLFMQGVQASQPAFGYKITGSSGSFIYGGGALYMGDGLILDAASGVTIQNIFAHGWPTFDQCTRNGVKLNAQAGGTISTVRLSDVWSCSNGLEGVLQTGAGTISNVRYLNMEVKNNGREGLAVETGSNFHVAGGQYESNSVLGSTTYSGVRIAAGLSGFSVKNATSTGAGQKYGLEIAAGGSDNYQVTGNDFRTNGTSALSDGGTGTNKQLFANLPLGTTDRLNVGNGASVKRILSGTATWDPGSLADGAPASTLVGVTGAVVGDPAFAGFTSMTAGNWSITAAVTATDQVTVSIINKTGGAVDLPSGTVRAAVVRF